MPVKRRRLDDVLVDRGLFENKPQAQAAVDDHRILAGGAPMSNSAALISADANLEVRTKDPFVSRGGIKLAGALTDLKVKVRGLGCLDAGAGSGGFTDALLQGGAARVVAVDVGYGQFDWGLRNDARVRLLERTNLRHLGVEEAGGPFDLIVADLSFISLRSVVPVLAPLATGEMLLMVKPQHEAPVEDVPRGGVVGDPRVWEKAVSVVARSLETEGFSTIGLCPSCLKGRQGNQEFFVHARRGGASLGPERIAEVVSMKVVH